MDETCLIGTTSLTLDLSEPGQRRNKTLVVDLDYRVQVNLLKL